LLRDFWIAPQPDLSAVQRRVRETDQTFASCVRGDPGTPPQCDALHSMMVAAAANPRLQPIVAAQIGNLQSLTAENIARSYVADRSPVTFKVIVNPLVTWMWVGGLIALSGALIAVWPSRGRRRAGIPVRTEADALKEAKYREIRDAELDHASGKISDEDFAVLDAELRREAVEILDRVGSGGGANGRDSNGHGVAAAGNGTEPTAEGDGTREKVEHS
jgi:hypothetical protein